MPVAKHHRVYLHTGMIGCGMAMTFEQLLVARWITGIGSALQNTGAQLFLADISTPKNRAQSLGINQVRQGCRVYCAGAGRRGMKLQLIVHHTVTTIQT